MPTLTITISADHSAVDDRHGADPSVTSLEDRHGSRHYYCMNVAVGEQLLSRCLAIGRAIILPICHMNMHSVCFIAQLHSSSTETAFVDCPIFAVERSFVFVRRLKTF